MNVLVVDDNSTNRKLLLAMLGAEGMTVFEAGDGVEALAVLGREKIDAIISDILMPRMDGYRLCYEVRRSERFQGIPFIIYTSTYTSPSDEKFSLELGADKFVRKPASAAEMLKLLRELSPHPRAKPQLQLPELAVLQEYSERLVAKLEEKNADLLRTTEELRKARDFHLTLLNDFPTPIWRSGVDAKCNYFNRTWLQFTGRKLEEELGDGWAQGVHPDDVARVVQEYLAAFHARQPFQLEYRLRRHDGVYRTIVDHGRPYNALGGSFAGYVGSCYDITEDKRAQRRIEGLARLGQKLNTAKTPREAGQIIVEVADQSLGWDACTFDLYSPETDSIQPVLKMDVVGGQRTEVSKSVTQQRPTARTRRVLQAGGQITLRDTPSFNPGTLPFGDTSRPSASIMTVPMRYGARVVGILSIHSYSRNAYERQALDTLQALADYCGGALNRIRTETELRESEERFRQLAENITKVFWMSDPQNTEIFYVSPAYEKIWGRSRESLYASPKSWFESVHPGDRNRVLEVEANQPANGGHDHTYRIVRPDGDIRWIHDRAFPIRDERGEIYRLAGLAEDITERKLAEDELRKSREQLRALAARVQAAREEESLRIAREIHDELGHSLTSLSIDLVTLEQSLEKDAPLPRGKILQRTKAMAKLIEETGRTVQRIAMDLRPSLLDDLGLAAALEWQANQFATRTGLRCRWRHKPADCELPNHHAIVVFRIFQEVLTNIARHARARKVNFDCSCNGGSQLLCIRDDGKGFDEKKLSTRDSLGLAGMRERALLIGGTVEIQSAPGRGTTVTLTVPIVAAQSATAGPKKTARRKKT